MQKKSRRDRFKCSDSSESREPYKKIIKTDEEENCQLILIASHSGGIIRDILLGSNTRNIIRKSKIPVFIEKFKDEEKDEQIATYNIQ